MHKFYYIVLICGLGLACNSSNRPVGFAAIDYQTEIIIQTPPASTASVRVDSASWKPLFLGLAFDAYIEVEGRYSLCFYNPSNQGLTLRYDLRFFDAETFLVDVFNPFNLPLHLPSQTSQCIDAEFFIRADDLHQAETLARMQVTIQIDTTATVP